MKPIEQLVQELSQALQSFDWKTVDTTCAEIAQQLRRSGEPPPPITWQVLSWLRRKRRFRSIAGLADALIYCGATAPVIKRQYAQALIDQSLLIAAEELLRGGLRAAAGTREEAEYQGLLGRIYKQWYVSAPSPRGPQDASMLVQAIDAYLNCYEASPAENYWHGINVVACAMRAGRDRVRLPKDVDAAQISSSILQLLDDKEQHAADLPAFDIATLMEAHLALGQFDRMIMRAREYVSHPQTDAFEVGSTIRQLTEVWGLNDYAPPGSSVLPVLRSRLAQAEGGCVELQAGEVAAERTRLELVHGFDSFQTLQWYRTGLECCDSIARVETSTGRGLGTGWLSRAGDWFQDAGDEPLLVTNAHVISPADRPFPNALAPEEATINLQVRNSKSAVSDVIFSSPVNELDCTIVRLSTPPPQTKPLTCSPTPVRLRVPPSRMYIIGHPGGRDLEFSLQDNYLVGCNDRLLHYRTPTEGGSSGSPVFSANWQVIGLHHAGDGLLPRLDGQPGTYAANEGIAVTALIQQTKKLRISAVGQRAGS